MARPRTYPIFSLSSLSIEKLKVALRDNEKIHVKGLGFFTIKRMPKRRVHMSRWGNVILKLPSRNKLGFRTSKEFNKFIQTIKSK